MSMDFLSALEFLDTNWDSCMNEDIFEAANSSSFDAISEKELYYQNQAELLQSQFLKQSLNQSQFEDLQKKINTASKQVHQNAEIVSKAVETISQLIPKENEANTEYVIQNNAISEAQTFFDSIWPIIRDNQNRFFPKLKTLIDKVSFQKSDPVLFLEYLGKVQKVVHFLKSHQELNQIPKLHDEINNFNENFQSIVTKLQNEIIHSFSDQVDNTTHEYINFYLDFVDYDFTKIEIIIKKMFRSISKSTNSRYSRKMFKKIKRFNFKYIYILL
ncbi:hypothetical protein TRFO_31101 [Tritrichomonas foetus]|uniref:Uncharacterized protein n=1 Tax=Tritrichomonas foetus TaxID=1144522 RepID=A0A1J4JT96_9EUKA|nr:hypothetical protein TRFO_31101 [Tritrichomonas foetus]|eukprot:OHT01962.1 hypothetical protein TRFO_31101 [Tritrichomonas foetus]